MNCTTSYLLCFSFLNTLCVAVLEQHSTNIKKGGVTAVGKSPSPAAWEAPPCSLNLTVSAWGNTLDVFRGAILGAWYAGKNVEGVLPLATTVTSLVLKTPYNLPEYKIVVAPPNKDGYGESCVL